MNNIIKKVSDTVDTFKILDMNKVINIKCSHYVKISYCLNKVICVHIVILDDVLFYSFAIFVYAHCRIVYSVKDKEFQMFVIDELR